jgi:hypothetical protein
LLRLRDRRRRGQTVWLVTNVLDKERLSEAQAGLYYRWRWENEMFHPHYPSSADLYHGQRAA